MLWIVGTPIGNLADLTERAKEVLSECNLILCEDTRRSGALLHHLNLKKPLKSYHKFNEKKELEGILSKLQEGHTLALLSDGGMPSISDPGQELIAACHEAKIAVSALPGPCAPILALVLSGFPPLPFQFIGFLPKKSGELTRVLAHIFHYPGTTVAFETPHRIVHTLQKLERLAPTLTLCLARELTKKFEECLIGTPSDILKAPSLQEPKGEMVLLFKEHPQANALPSLSPKEHVAYLERTFDLTQKEAIKIASSLTHTSKKALYRQFTD